MGEDGKTYDGKRGGDGKTYYEKRGEDKAYQSNQGNNSINTARGMKPHRRQRRGLGQFVQAGHLDVYSCSGIRSSRQRRSLQAQLGSIHTTFGHGIGYKLLNGGCRCLHISRPVVLCHGQRGGGLLGLGFGRLQLQKV